ncbi:LLM class flavin-dependent oxidoreductase [Aquihabitans sp. G128]|uniref:LLM class flavin-dependent oxidoreductase n=1 Tax=Aquihabitans sp. G128 TaxID=2849779 RepID=UPI001C23585C|nr:LLM class flavin-dependent oxidoreductase [Aquihabitans sp. G128]QXC60865.1 LLM class flavin-dependent oxidoreductase [Aquihabitans sp. G128]
MSSPRMPLSVLDLSPISSGSTAGQALRNSLDLATRIEAAGYRRHWVAEHHFTPGVASSAPALLIGQIAAATSTIRVGSAAVQTGHQTALSIVEQFGILDALFPGRIDLGLGRSGQRRSEALAALEARQRAAEVARLKGGGAKKPRKPPREAHVVDGLLIPKPFDPSGLFGSSRFRYQAALQQQPGAESPDYGDQVAEVLALIAGSLETPDGDLVHATPGEGAGVDVWIFGSSAGQSAEVAGVQGLPFTANYHVSPATVLDALGAYREAFRPSAHLAAPYVAVSADVVVAEDDATAQRLASPFGLWVRSIRTGQGAVAYPSPEEADGHRWTDEDRALVADRVDTQFVGTPDAVVEQLEVLARVTGADELVVTSITHQHADRVRSHELLAEAWSAGAPAGATPVGALVGGRAPA